jgi:hypothetical protein
MTTTAAKASAAADALLAWLNDQKPPVFARARPTPPDAALPKPDAGMADAAGLPAEPEGDDRPVAATPMTPAPEPPPAATDDREPPVGTASASGTRVAGAGAPLRLARTD